MKEQLISFETAKLAKEKGFDLPCKSRFIVMKTKIKTKTNPIQKSRAIKNNNYARPTQSLLQKWLRDVHNIDVNPMRFDLNGYWVNLQRGIESNSDFYKTNLSNYKTYELALEQGLIEALKLIKN